VTTSRDGEEERYKSIKAQGLASLSIAREVGIDRDTVSQSSYQEVLDDLVGVQAVRFEARGKAWLWRTELPGVANDAFRAVGLRPPSRVQPLN
jgi:hypothetical protein